MGSASLGRFVARPDGGELERLRAELPPVTVLAAARALREWVARHGIDLTLVVDLHEHTEDILAAFREATGHDLDRDFGFVFAKDALMLVFADAQAELAKEAPSRLASYALRPDPAAGARSVKQGRSGRR